MAVAVGTGEYALPFAGREKLGLNLRAQYRMFRREEL
jgi:hypothetical protein